MVDILGVKRLAILAILAGINLIIAGVAYGFLAPQVTKMQRQLRSVTSQLNTVRSDLGNIRVEFDQLEDQQDQFEALKEKKFFDLSVRSKMDEYLTEAETLSQVTVGPGLSISAPSFVDDMNAAKSDSVLAVSQAKFNISALTDRDIFRYIWELENSLPGYMALQSVILERKTNISRTVLQAVAANENPEIISANIEGNWILMIPKETADQLKAQQLARQPAQDGRP